MWLLHFAPTYNMHFKIVMQVLHLMFPHIVWIKDIMWLLHFAPTWDCRVHHWCFYLHSKSQYFGICTTWWNNNNGLKVISITNSKIKKYWVHESSGKCWVKLSMILFLPRVMKASMLSFNLMGMYMMVWRSSNIACCTPLSLNFFHWT